MSKLTVKPGPPCPQCGKPMACATDQQTEWWMCVEHGRQEPPTLPYKVFLTPDSGEMQADPDGSPHCPDCGGPVMKCGIDLYKCRKCGEGWTMTPCPSNK